MDEVCRKAGISEATYYLWKRQYPGVGVSELRQLRQLRKENGRLKRAGGPAFDVAWVPHSLPQFR